MSDTLSPLGYDFFADVEGTRSMAHTLEAGVRFKTQLNALSRLEENLFGLPARLQALEEQGVAIPATLVDQMGRQTEQLKQVSAETREVAERYQQSLQPRVDALWRIIEQNDRLIGEDGYEAHGQAITSNQKEGDRLKLEMEQAEEAIHDCFNEAANQTRLLLQQVTHLERAAEALKAATFTLDRGEVLIDAAEGAEQLQPGGQPLEGVLFLTTQRLIFEQRQEVVKSRFFLFSKKERIEKVRFAEPLNQVSNVSLQPQHGAQRLHLTLTKRANVPHATFGLNNHAQQWLTRVNQVRLGELQPTGSR
ncbi:MAG: hypothetical protein ACPGWR_21870 [Ardenticatenaceae bacterium]